MVLVRRLDDESVEGDDYEEGSENGPDEEVDGKVVGLVEGDEGGAGQVVARVERGARGEGGIC